MNPPFKMKSKKAQLFETWVEFLFVLLFVGGIILALAIENVFLGYLVLFFIGMICGRIIYQRSKIKKTYQFPFYFILSGLLLGYLIGLGYGNNIALIITFIIGVFISHYMHKHKYIE